ncbi:cell wall-binding repeat-containing protein [Metaclostridioides mangenotii]|uniref:cell wall-binding repeat-containing protein n=1 Tax=Metaclostridioides mangenotii TaxID=1540 RepID=UPI000467BC80|nr:cell wall-binding repeat-containing protein [Clostridioides mangenotii]
MSKKRNLAVLMAAATVATSVAPVFAAEAADLDEASLRTKVQELLNVKYSDPSEEGKEDNGVVDGSYTNSVYKIMAGSTRIKDIADLNVAIEDAKVAGNDLVVTVIDKGHVKTNDGKIVYKIKTKNEFVEKVDTTLFDAIKVASPAIKDAKYLDIKGEYTDEDAKATAIEVELMNGKKFNVEAGQFALEFNKPLDANGNAIVGLDTDSDLSVKKSVNSFEVKELTGDATYKTAPSFKFAEYTMGSKVTIEKNLSDYYSKDGGYTEIGVNLVEQLSKAVDTGESSIVVDGVRYAVKGINAAGTSIKASKDGYELTMNFNYKKADATKWSDIKLVLKSNSQEDLSRVKNDIIAKNEVVEGRLTTLAGENRFSTAVEVSKDAYEPFKTAATDKKAGAIVLVGENAIVDGLASAPLASQKNAPILLTKADAVPAQTMDEIKRVVDKGADIYVVGGKTTISEAVESQLKSELNASIIRVSGEDRYATSTAIAEKLDKSKNDAKKAYVVGGEGLADAMSIAAYAAQTGAPILVNPSDKLAKDVKLSLKDQDITKVAVIGGATHISTQALKDIADTDGITEAKRISGVNRSETNAKVIKGFYAETRFDNPKADSVFIAKDGSVGGNGQLIDALAVAPSAAKAQAPIVLAGTTLSKDQDDNVKAYVTLNNKPDGKKVYQVGQGVAADALKAVLKTFGL